MYYYTFKAVSNNGDIIRNYIYNIAVDKNLDMDFMMDIVKEYIKKDFKNKGYNIKDFRITRKLSNYKDISSEVVSYKFIEPNKKVTVCTNSKDSDQNDSIKESKKKDSNRKHHYKSKRKRDPRYHY